MYIPLPNIDDQNWNRNWNFIYICSKYYIYEYIIEKHLETFPKCIRRADYIRE
jgi:hypothetical protein